MKSNKNIMLAGFFVLLFTVSLSAASQDLTVQGNKNLRSANMHLSADELVKSLSSHNGILSISAMHRDFTTLDNPQICSNVIGFLL